MSSKPLWMTKNVLRLVRKKRRLWRWYASSKDYQEYIAFKKVQDEVKKAVKNAKRNFEKKLAKDARKNNTKPFYSYMKKKTDNRVGVGPLKDSCSELITDDETMAEFLNASFALFLQKKIVHTYQQLSRGTVETTPWCPYISQQRKFKRNLRD